MRKNWKEIQRIYREEIEALRQEPENYLAYLETAGRHYKYDFADALLIHKLHPQARALAEPTFWRQAKRSLKPDAPVVIVSKADGSGFRRLVDASDTLGKDDPGLQPWRYAEKDFEEIRKNTPYPLSKRAQEADTLETMTANLAFDRGLEWAQEQDVDEDQQVVYAQVTAAAAAQCVVKRCELESRYDHPLVLRQMLPLLPAEHFIDVQILVDGVREDVLTEIGNAARKRERERRQYDEQSRNEDQSRQWRGIHARGRSVDSELRAGSGAERTAESLGEDGAGIHADETAQALPGIEDERRAVRYDAAGGRRSERADLPDLQAATKEAPTARQRDEPAGARSAPEQPESAGGGDRDRGIHLPEPIEAAQEEEETAAETPLPSLYEREFSQGERVFLDDDLFEIKAIRNGEAILQAPDFPIMMRVMAMEDLARELSIETEKEEQGRAGEKTDASLPHPDQQQETLHNESAIVPNATSVDHANRHLDAAVQQRQAEIDTAHKQYQVAKEKVPREKTAMDDTEIPLRERVISRDAVDQRNSPSVVDRTAPKADAAFSLEAVEGIGAGGQKTKYKDNIAAIELLLKLENEQRAAAPEEQQVLARYVGWGGIPQAFDEKNEKWKEEYEQLKGLLGEEEYAAARASTLNAHYTPPGIISEMYRVVERFGFTGGRVLEPSMGVGHFFGMMPEAMRKNSRMTGVELDSITGRIAQKLYPDTEIRVQGFEEAKLPDNQFDLAVGNVPFGNYQVVDPRYDHLKLNIHDYFIAKTLDTLRVGGVAAVITTNGTLDKRDERFRRYMAERADLVGAVRLPNNAFAQMANTQVTTDILFLQKHAGVPEEMPDWVGLDRTAGGVALNRYFVDNPDMLLGEMVFDKNMYGDEKDTACRAVSGRDLMTDLHQAVNRLETVIPPRVEEAPADTAPSEDGKAPRELPAPADVKDYCYTLRELPGFGRQLYYREGNILSRADKPKKTEERIIGMMGIRDAAREVVQVQLAGCTDEELSEKQRVLSDRYEAFCRAFPGKEKGFVLSDKANERAFRGDAQSAFVLALETEKGEKSPLFYERTILPPKVITSVESIEEALQVTLNERGYVELTYMAGLCGKAPDTIMEEAEGRLFFSNPDGEQEGEQRWFLTADEYLSGNVREKLERAEEAATLDPRYEKNVEALRAVQPTPLEAREITARLGQNWIPTEDVSDFVKTLIPESSPQVQYHPITGNWGIEGFKPRGVAATRSYGTDRADAYTLLEMAMNSKQPRIFDTDYEGNRIFNQKETMMAVRKMEEIQQAFVAWVFEDPQRRERLVDIYNERFNSDVERSYDGSYLSFPGMSATIQLNPHQKDAVARILQNGNTLLSHPVGSGKTFTIIAAAMEKKRLGLANKQIITVPKHLTKQWGRDFRTLYPNANVLVASDKDFEAKNRKKFIARIATGNYDAIVMSHQQFGRIPISPQRERDMIHKQLSELEIAIADSPEYDFSVKEMEKMRKQLRKRLEGMHDRRDKDTALTFEELGVDGVFVDESHEFKRLAFVTHQKNIAGLSTGGSQRASDMFAKTSYLNELTAEKGVVFATGTPVSNTMAELFSIQRYLQPREMERKKLGYFDAWAKQFAEVTTQMELKVAGTGYRPRTRFARFHNLPELMRGMYRKVADIKVPEELNLDVPELFGGKMQTAIAEASEYQMDYIQELDKRSDNISRGLVEPREDNMLKICSDGRLAALDMRLIDPNYPDNPNGKLAMAADNIAEKYHETADKRLTQIVFCDLGTPKKDGSYSVYNDLNEKLAARGVNPDDIAFIHDAATDKQKEDMFARVRSGEIRVIMGSTPKMGAGTNMQTKAYWMHDLDPPWTPKDIEQRGGRILRQGNENPVVGRTNYVTKQTFDSYMWQINEIKQGFVGQVMRGDASVRSMEDLDTTQQSYAEIKAITSGNPLIKESMEVDAKVQELSTLKTAYLETKRSLDSDVRAYFPKRIRSLERSIEQEAQDWEKAEPLLEKSTGGAFEMQIAGKHYRDAKEAGKALYEEVEKTPHGSEREIGRYGDFDLTIKRKSAYFESDEDSLIVKGTRDYKMYVGSYGAGNIERIHSKLSQIPDQIQGYERSIQQTKIEIESAKAELQKPFALEEELKTAILRKGEIDTALGKTTVVAEDIVSEMDEQEIQQDTLEEEDFVVEL